MIIGNVGTDPEMRYSPNGNPVTTFRMATSRNYTTAGGERRQETEWFSVVTWNQLAEQVSQYLTKGRRAYVEGRLHSRQYAGPDGQQRFQNEIVANKVLFLDRQPVEGPAGEEGAAEPAAAPSAAADAEDLPF